MKVLIGGRRFGRTTETIRLARKYKWPIVVFNNHRRSQLKNEYPDVEFILFDDLKKYQQIPDYCIDDFDIVIEEVFKLAGVKKLPEFFNMCAERHPATFKKAEDFIQPYDLDKLSDVMEPTRFKQEILAIWSDDEDNK